MLTRFKNHCSNPITWGAYYKVCAGSFVASTVLALLVYGKTIYDYRKAAKGYDDFQGEEL